YREAEEAEAPAFIVARTERGHGVSFLADRPDQHGKPLSEDDAARAIEELGGQRRITVTPLKPEAFDAPEKRPVTYRRPVYREAVATRKAFGEALAALGPARPGLVVLDGEVGNSTHTEDFAEAVPDRFFQMYIGEQNMIGAAVGMQALGKTAFAATFGAFLTRAYDFIRMAAIGRADLRLCGSHAGVSIGEDGPSQMALEDLAMMRALHGSTVLYPADGNATVRLVEAMAERAGISYLRATREKTPSLYPAEEEFPIGGSKVLRSTEADRATVVGAGITLFEALRAAQELAGEGIPVRVIDAYSVKPVDAATLRRALEETGLVVVVEDHWPEGGLGDAVFDAVASKGDVAGRLVKLAVRGMPGSGSPEELRDWAGISADRIAAVVRDLA
ncbi:MAG: transketolase, partial [Actinomycetota bacterium]|nr:transketolase [Actinomycetota bacterium]